MLLSCACFLSYLALILSLHMRGNTGSPSRYPFAKTADKLRWDEAKTGFESGTSQGRQGVIRLGRRQEINKINKFSLPTPYSRVWTFFTNAQSRCTTSYRLASKSSASSLIEQQI